MDRQLDHKCGAFPRSFAARENRASVHLNDRLTDGEAKSEAFAARIELLKGIEDLVEKFGFDPNAAVADLDGDYVRCRVGRAYRNRAVFRREFAGVAKHVPENLLQAWRVDAESVQKSLKRDGKLKMSIFDFGAHDLDGVLKQFVHIGGAKLKLYFATREAAEIE